MSKKLIEFWHMHAKKEGVCSETGKPISVGDLILFPTGRGSAYSKHSKIYKQYHDAAVTGHKDCGC